MVFWAEQMYGTYALRPYDRTPELNQAMGVIRLFLRHRQPHLHGWVLYAHVARARGRQADPQAIVLQALREDPQSSGLCALLASPLGQVALDALALGFRVGGSSSSSCRRPHN